LDLDLYGIAGSTDRHGNLGECAAYTWFRAPSVGLSPIPKATMVATGRATPALASYVQHQAV
jgi:hypothetical protein